MPTTRPFGSMRQRGRLYEASYWHNGRRHVAPTTFGTKGDARAFLSAVEADIRRGVWIDPWAGRFLVWELAEEWIASNPNKRESTSAREELTLRLHMLPTIGEIVSSGSGRRTSSGSSIPGVPSKPRERSSATTRWCGPCSATPCVTTGWPGTRAATLTCRRSRAPGASSSPPRTSPASPSRWLTSTGRWSGSGRCWDCAGPRWPVSGWAGSTSTPDGSRWPRGSCGGRVVATSSGRPSRKRDTNHVHAGGHHRDAVGPPRTGRIVRRRRHRCAGVHRR